MVRNALAVLEAPLEPPELADREPGTWDTVTGGPLDGLPDLPDRIFAALKAALEDSDRAADLNDQIKDLRHRRLILAATRPTRPWTSLVRTAAAILDELNSSLRYFLLALNADTPIEAQRAAHAGQRYLERATELADPLGDLLSVWWEDIDNPIDLVQGLIKRVEETTGITDPLELDAHGALELKTLLGSDFVCPPGLGLGALVLVLTSRLLFDEVEYSRIAQEAFKAFRRRPERLREVASEPQLTADLAQATDSVMSGSLIASTVAAANLPDHAHLTVALDLARSIVEGPGKRLVAALLAVDGRRPYGTWRSKDISALLPAAKGGRLRPAVGDLELSLRHAAAHQDFRLDGDRIVLGESHNPECISAPELLDRLLAGAESAYAVYLALLAAAAEQEIDLTDSRGLRVLGLAGGEAVAVTLRLFGWDVTNAQLRGHRLEVEARIGFDTRLMTALAAAITGLREEEGVTEVEAALELPDRRVRKLVGPMGPWHRYMKAVGDDAKIAANVLIYATWTLDGQALIDRPMIRKYASIQACRYAEAGYPACIAPLRSLTADAISLSDVELARALRALNAMIRSGNEGLSADHDRKIVQNTLFRWLDIDVGEGDFIQDSVGGVESRRGLPTD